MNKTAIAIIGMLIYSSARAQQFGSVKTPEIDYGEYSDNYMKCIQNMASSHCNVEEYYHLKKSVDELLDKLTSLPNISQYNNTEFSLRQNVAKRRQYSESLCQMKANLLESAEAADQCRMDSENTLFVDLYKLYEASPNKK